ncbi:MAG TPA: hypothetical protein VGZ22_16305 [Isosphaeraceae bacterium]|nr:hypothetical protein [Isosphaeraceae bacterium]
MSTERSSAQVRTIDEMMRILEALPDQFEVCFEASCGYGHYHDLLRPIAARVLVAHPGQLRSSSAILMTNSGYTGQAMDVLVALRFTDGALVCFRAFCCQVRRLELSTRLKSTTSGSRSPRTFTFMRS